MGLYEGDDLVSVQTPDGRTLTIPRSLVPPSMLTNNLGAPADVSPVPSPGGGPDIAAPMLPVNEPPPLVGMQPPASMPGPFPGAGPGAAPEVGDYLAGRAMLPQNDAQVNQANARFAQNQARQASQAATPAGKTAAALEGVQKAIGQEADSAVKQADIEAAGQFTIGSIQGKRNDDLDKLFTQRAEQAQADQAAQDQKMAELVALRQKIANTKIDRSIDHPVLAMIGIAMSGIGSAMQHRYDGQPIDQTAMNIVFKGIDRKVANQMADLDLKKTALGLTKEELGVLKDKASSRLALNNMLIAGAAEKAARQVEEITTKTGSDAVRERGKQLAAQLRQRGAGITLEAVKAQNEYDQKEKFQKQDIGYKYSALGENARQHNDEMQVKREEIAADMQKALAAANASGGAAAMKQLYELQQGNETRGIFNVATGEPLLKKEGAAQIKQADALEQQANDMEVTAGQAGMQLTPEQNARASQLRAKASEIRGNARLLYTYRGRDPVQAGKLSDEYAAGQQIASLVDDIKLIYDDTGRRYVSTNDKQAAIQAKASELMMHLKTAWQLGVLSKNDTLLLDKATGGDMTAGWDFGNISHVLGLDLGLDPEAFKRRLETLSGDTESAVKQKMKTDGFDGDTEDLFHHKTAPEDSPDRKAVKTISQGKTPVEESNSDVESGKGPVGALRTGIQGVFYGTTPNREAKAAEQAGSLSRPGLSTEQAAAFDQLLGSYKAGNKRAGELLVQQALTPRADLSLALMHNLRDAGGAGSELYAQARNGIKTGPVAKQLDDEEKTLLAPPLIPTAMLAQQVLMTDDLAGKKELVRRATSGDKLAQKWALDNVMNKRGK